MNEKIFVDVVCKCGCGETLGNVSRNSYYKIKRGVTNAGYKIGHGNKGDRNPQWKDGTRISQEGYRLIRVNYEHPNQQAGGYILEHRFVMSQHLSRPLHPNEIVHHKDHNKLNNHIDNLEITTREDHQKDHHTRIKKLKKVCPNCGKPYSKHGTAANNRSKFCSRECRYAIGNSLCRKVSLEQEKEILELRGKVSRKNIAEIYGISIHGVSTVYYRNRIT